MPHEPEDDWTRPMPRPARGSGSGRDPRRGRGSPADEATVRMPRGERGAASDPPQREVVSRGRARYADEPDWPRYLHEDDSVDEVDQANEWDHDEQAAPPPRQGGRGGRGSGGRDGGGPPQRPAKRRRPRYGVRRFIAVVLVLCLAYVIAMIWAVTSVWNSIDRVDAAPSSTSRPASASGTNFLLVGTDSRDNLDRDQRNELSTGHSADSARADTIMLLHLPDDGGPVLLSIPRDSWVDIPGEGENKINAAYHIGGPGLLVDAVEQSTGLRIEGYLEVGFAGFVEVVENVGGIRMCLDEPIQDSYTKLDLPAGCQNLVGSDALGYVRMRYADPRGDLGRVERQREFLAALSSELATPGTVLVPWRLHDAGTATGAALAIGEDTSMWETARMAWAMRELSGGSGHSLTVPIADPNYSTWAGSAVLWDAAAADELFTALNEGEALSVEP